MNKVCFKENETGIFYIFQSEKEISTTQKEKIQCILKKYLSVVNELSAIRCNFPLQGTFESDKEFSCRDAQGELKNLASDAQVEEVFKKQLAKIDIIFVKECSSIEESRAKEC